VGINKVLNVQERREPILLAILEVKFNQKLVERAIAKVPLKRGEVKYCGGENGRDSHVSMQVETEKFEVP
jgi:hypothetical protein